MVTHAKEKPLNRVVGFLAEWYDASRQSVRTFKLHYFEDGCVELLDTSNHKTFLSKTHVASLKPSQLYVGSTIEVFSRLLHLVDYSDAGTCTYMEKMRQRAFALVLPSALSGCGEVLSAILGGAGGIVLAQLRLVSLAQRSALPDRLAVVAPADGSAVALELVTDTREGGWQAWSKLATVLQVNVVQNKMQP
jgi:hypothetical protein